MSRKTSRENAFKMIFAMITKGDDRIPEGFYEDSKDSEIWSGKEASEEDRTYIEKVCPGVSEKEAELDEIIKKYLKNWTIERINRVCLAALRLCIYEMLYMEEIPVKVSAAETVEIVKKYAGEEEGKFVNGLLGEYIRKELEG